jgi:predicted protein tyrosine phosphatase
MSHILFVCTEGKDRSPTACRLWGEKYPEDEVKSLGLFIENEKIVLELLNWADVIYCMESRQVRKILDLNPKFKSKIRILDIPDNYQRDQAELVKLLKEKFKSK